MNKESTSPEGENQDTKIPEKYKKNHGRLAGTKKALKGILTTKLAEIQKRGAQEEASTLKLIKKAYTSLKSDLNIPDKNTMDNEQRKLLKKFREWMAQIGQIYTKLPRGAQILGVWVTGSLIVYQVVDEGMELVTEWSSPIDDLIAIAPIQALPKPLEGIDKQSIQEFAVINKSTERYRGSVEIIPADSTALDRIVEQMIANLGRTWTDETILDELWKEMEERLGSRIDKPTKNEVRNIESKLALLLDNERFLNEIRKALNEITLECPVKKENGEEGYFMHLNPSISPHGRSTSIPIWITIGEFKGVDLKNYIEGQILLWKKMALKKIQKGLIECIFMLSGDIDIKRANDTFVLTAKPLQPSQEEFFKKAIFRIIKTINESCRDGDEDSYSRRFFDVNFYGNYETLAQWILANESWPKESDDLKPYRRDNGQKKEEKQDEIPESLLGFLNITLEELQNNESILDLDEKKLMLRILKIDEVIKKLLDLVEQSILLNNAHFGALIAEIHNRYHCAISSSADMTERDSVQIHSIYAERYEDPNPWDSKGQSNDQGEKPDWDLRFEPIVSVTFKKSKQGDIVLVDTRMLSLIERSMRWIRVHTCSD